MPSDLIAPLVVADEAFLVASLIERCPKTMMLRELLINAIEAACTAESGPSIVRVGATLVSGAPKLRIWNTGPGLSASELDQICDIASSVRKVVGLDNNFGMGAKVASLPSNHRGVVYRSCKAGRVHQVIIGGHDGVYGRLLQRDPNGGQPVRVIDVTGQCGDDHDLSTDWTEVVLLGNHDDQDTVAAPYDGAPAVPSNWVATSLTQRFFRLPGVIKLELLPGIAGSEITTFLPAAERSGEFTRSESVTAADGTVIHYYYLEEPAGGIDSALPAHDLRGVAGIVYRDEIYALRTGNAWAIDAPAFGVSFGARTISVFVELADDAAVRPEAYRQFLRVTEGDQHQVTLADYAGMVRAAMPEWLRQIIASIAPRQANYLSEVRDELKSLVAELDLLADEPPAPKPPAQQSGSSQSASKFPPPLPARRLQLPPELIALHDQNQIDERNLNGRAAQYVPSARQLFINMLYPGVLRMALHLGHAFADAPDQDRVKALATEIAEWSTVRLIARGVVFSLTKKKEGWSNDEISRAQSPESLTLIADNYQIGLPAAQRRLASLLSESGPVAVIEGKVVDDAELGRLRDRQRHEVELLATEQAARRALAAGVSAPAPFMRRLSEIASRRNDAPLSLEWARRAVEANNNDPWSHHHLSGLLLSAGDMGGATQAAMKALDLTAEKSHPALLCRMVDIETRNSDKQAALTWARKAVEADETYAWAHFSLSGALLTVDRLDEAEKEARLAVSFGPQPPHSAFCARLGDIYTRRGNLEAAVEWTKRAVEADSSNIWAQFSLAGLLMSSGRLEEAAQASRQAVILSGSNVPVAIARRFSEIELARYNLPKAVEWARRAVATEPTDGWAQYQLSVVLQRHHDLPGASAAAEAAVATAGMKVPSSFWRRLSEIRVEQGNMPEAISLARKAAAADPKDPWSSLHVARLLLTIRDLDEAVTAAQQALNASQHIRNGIFSRSLSEIHVARREYDRALAWARKAVLIDENDAWSQSHLAGVLLTTGDLDGAERAARLALIQGSPSGMSHFASVIKQIELRRGIAVPVG